MRGPLCVVLGLAVASGHLLFGHADQATPAPQEPLPAFRTGVEAVQIDAFVTDAAGVPVTNLTVDDFEILENGMPVPIVAFGLVNIPVAPGSGPAERWPLASDVQANNKPSGRTFVFALDEVATDHALRTRAFVRRFLEEHFGPHDIGAVVLTGRGLVTSGQAFTSSPRLLLDAVDRFSGGFGTLDSSVNCVPGERQSPPIRSAPTSDGRTVIVSGPTLGDITRPASPEVRNRLASLRELMESLAAVPGGRTTLLYFTHCIGFDMFDVIDYRGGVLSLAGEDAHAAMAAATRGNIVVYPIDPAGLQVGEQSLQGRMDLTALATATGGVAFSNTNNFSAAFERIVRENSAYYVLAFSAAYPRRDGRYVPIEVRVRRPGLRVQARDGYVAPRGRAPAPVTSVSGALDALAHPLATNGIGLEVTAAPYKGTGREAAVALAFEIDTATLTAGEAALPDLEVTYTAIDDRNRAYPGGRHSAIPPEARGTPLRIVSQLALPAGRYQLRAAVAAGLRTGSVVYDLDVPDFGRDALQLSGLALTSAAAGGAVTVRPAPSTDRRQATRCRPPSCTVPLVSGAPSAEDPLRDGLPGPPTTVRSFDRHDSVVLYAEVYQRLRRVPPYTITVTTTLQDAAGRVWPLATERRPSTAPPRPSGGHGFAATLPLQKVPPGSYILQVEARSDGGAGAVVTRAIPISVR